MQVNDLIAERPRSRRPCLDVPQGGLDPGRSRRRGNAWSQPRDQRSAVCPLQRDPVLRFASRQIVKALRQDADDRVMRSAGRGPESGLEHDALTDRGTLAGEVLLPRTVT